MEVKLKRCPFCPKGGDPFVFGGFVQAGMRVVECGQCGSRGTLYGSGNAAENEDRAIEAWNTRTPSPREARLEGALRQLANNDLNDTNCASVEVAAKRVRNIAADALKEEE
jgi:Lar family restriction alleviation protein